jgi:hypothetical protein
MNAFISGRARGKGNDRQKMCSDVVVARKTIFSCLEGLQPMLQRFIIIMPVTPRLTGLLVQETPAEKSSFCLIARRLEVLASQDFGFADIIVFASSNDMASTLLLLIQGGEAGAWERKGKVAADMIDLSLLSSTI